MDNRGHSATAGLETIEAIALPPIDTLYIYIYSFSSSLLERLSNSTTVLPTAYTLIVPFQCSPLQLTLFTNLRIFLNRKGIKLISKVLPLIVATSLEFLRSSAYY